MGDDDVHFQVAEGSLKRRLGSMRQRDLSKISRGDERETRVQEQHKETELKVASPSSNRQSIGRRVYNLCKPKSVHLSIR